MLRAGLRFIAPLAMLAASAICPAKAQIFTYGWAGSALPQFGYGYGCPPVSYAPYCSFYPYGHPYVLRGYGAGYTLPYFSRWAYYPYRAGYYGYGTPLYYRNGLRYPLYRAVPPVFRSYGAGYWDYRGGSALGYRSRYSGERSSLGTRFGSGAFRGGGFRGGGRR